MTHTLLRPLSLTLALWLAAACSSPPVLAPQPPAPKIASFTVTPTLIASGAQVTFSWSTVDAPEVRIVDGRGSQLAGVDNKPSGTLMLPVTQNSIYVLEALNSRGVKATALRSVALEGTEVAIVFRAIPETLLPGQTATLAWTAPGAKVVTITPGGGAALDLGGQLEAGSVSASPDAASTTYTMDADGAQQTVTLRRQAELVEFKATPDLGAPGDKVTLSWKTRFATKVTLSAPGRGPLKTVTDAAQLAESSFEDTLPIALPGTSLPYTLAVEGLGLAEERNLLVLVGVQPVLLTATANPYALEGLSFPIAWTTQQADVVRIKQGATVLFETQTAAQAAAGTFAIATPTAKTDYTVEAARNGFLATASQTLSVEPVGAIKIVSFTATPAVLPAAGQPVTLAWDAPNGRSLSITDETGFEVFSLNNDTGAASGSVQVYPPGPTTTYTLRVTNTVEAVRSDTETVTVTTPFVSTVVGGGRPLQGVPSDITWDIGGTSPPIQGLPFPDFSEIPNSTGFIDISTTGLKLNPFSQDDSTTSVTITGFSSRVLGSSVANTIVVSTNGFFVFGPFASARGTVTSISDAALEKNFVAPFWSDLLLGAQSTIHVQVLNQAPERTLVVQWTKMRPKTAPERELTFQARVTQSGIISFDYKDFDPATLLSAYGLNGQNASLATPLPVQGTEVRVGGARAAPISLTFQSRNPLSGFIKIGTNYLRAAIDPNPLLVSDLTISEVLYQPASAIAATGEWFELINGTNTPVDLEGFTLDFGGGQPQVTLAAATGTTVVPPNGALIFSQSAQGPANDGVATNYVYGTANTLSDTTGTLALAKGAFVVSSSWDSASPNSGGVGVTVVRDPGPLLLSTDTTNVPHAVSCQPTPSQTFGSQPTLQRGTPGTNGGCFAYAYSPIAFNYRDISSTGTAIFNTTIGTVDDTVATVTLAAPMPYFSATPTTTLTVSSNGWAALKTVATSALSNKVKPTPFDPTGVIAVFWDDLITTTTPGSNVYSQRFAANADPLTPAPHTVIQWHRLRLFGNASSEVNAQLKLFDSGLIEYHFALLSDPGSSATTWLETVDGLTALVINNNTSLLRSNTAFRFSPR